MKKVLSIALIFIGIYLVIVAILTYIYIHWGGIPFTITLGVVLFITGMLLTTNYNNE